MQTEVVEVSPGIYIIARRPGATASQEDRPSLLLVTPPAIAMTATASGRHILVHLG